jgi:hypothetical protein
LRELHHSVATKTDGRTTQKVDGSQNPPQSSARYASFRKWACTRDDDDKAFVPMPTEWEALVFTRGRTHGDANLGNFLVSPNARHIVSAVAAPTSVANSGGDGGDDEREITTAEAAPACLTTLLVGPLVVIDNGGLVVSEDGLPCYEYYQCCSSVRRQITTQRPDLVEPLMRGFASAYPDTVFGATERALASVYWRYKSGRPLHVAPPPPPPPSVGPIR